MSTSIQIVPAAADWLQYAKERVVALSNQTLCYTCNFVYMEAVPRHCSRNYVFIYYWPWKNTNKVKEYIDKKIERRLSCDRILGPACRSVLQKKANKQERRDTWSQRYSLSGLLQEERPPFFDTWSGTCHSSRFVSGQVLATETIFSYNFDIGESYDTMQNLNLKPTFSVTLSSTDTTTVTQLCQTAAPTDVCVVDFVLTRITTFALRSQSARTKTVNLQSTLSKYTVACLLCPFLYPGTVMLFISGLVDAAN